MPEDSTLWRELDDPFQREEIIQQELSLLPVLHRIAFAASCCERHCPVFIAFSLMADAGNPKIVLEALDALWGYLRGEASETKLSALLERRKAVHPEFEDADFGMDLLVYPAWVAEGFLFTTLECCLHTDPEKLTWPGIGSLNLIHDYAKSVSKPYSDEEAVWGRGSSDFSTDIKHNPLMREEISKQQKDLEVLKSQANLDVAFLDYFRSSSQVGGIHPFRRGLIPWRLHRSITEQEPITQGLIPRLLYQSIMEGD